MSYTAPLGNAANASWVGAPAYTPPLGNAANATWQDASPPGGVEGTATAAVTTLAPTGQVLAAFGGISATAAATVATLSISGAALAGAGQAAVVAGQVAGLAVTGAAAAQLVTAGAAMGVVPFAAGVTGAATAQHPRYELRGQVRLAGNPVERRVRAYARSTGALLGQGDTTGGFFRIPAGFAEIECTVLPIDLATDATDYEPPTANRVLCVLAEDDA